jgi:glyoxalase family protein
VSAFVQLEGIHHVTAITADGPRNVDFYARVLGLRLAKKTVNQDDPTAYHLFFTDEQGSAGSDLTFFEYPGARQGRPGAGMVRRVVYRVAGAAALDFWAERLGGEGVETARADGSLTFADPEGLELELRVVEVPDAPLTARSLEVPDEHALQGFHAVHATMADPAPTERMLAETLGFADRGAHVWEARGEARGGCIHLAGARVRGFGGAGTVHHVAWAARMEDHEAWRERVAAAQLRPTPVIDRFYFRSVYFREPGGVLFELATIGPGFTADEPLEHLGERLSLPPAFEPLRDQVERILTPLPDTRRWRPAPAPAGR